MSIRFAGPALAAVFAAFAFSGAAHAQANAMKECSVEYQAAKKADTLAGKTWNQYLAECRTRHAAQPAATPAAPAANANPLKPAPTAAAPAAPGAPAATKAEKPAAAPSEGRQAMLARERACGAEWKAKKVDLRKTNPNLKWPQFWSECNTRMKGGK